MFPFESIAYAMGPAPAEGGPLGAFVQFVPLVLIFAIFWFLVIRPQQKKAKVHREMVSTLKKGDEIYTDSGIRGTIVRLADDVVQLEIAPKVVIRLQRGRIADVVKEAKGAEGKSVQEESGAKDESKG